MPEFAAWRSSFAEEFERKRVAFLASVQLRKETDTGTVVLDFAEVDRTIATAKAKAAPVADV